ncbi:MAG: T9SS type A sorting domain-containing protein [Candidatus Limimorpha sp.]
MKKIFLALLFPLFTAFYLNAQNSAIFTIEKTDGTQIDMPMGSNDEITFSNSEIIVSNQGQTINIALQEINKAFFQKTTSLNSVNKQSLSIFPNPAKDIIRINNLEGNNEVSIITLQGQTIKKSDVTNDGNIDISDLNPGVYIINVGKLVSKFIKL